MINSLFNIVDRKNRTPKCSILRINLEKILADLLNLKRIKLDWRFAAKHGDHDFELAFSGVDFSNGAFEAFEGTICNRDNFIKSVIDGVFWILNAHTLFDFSDFLLGNWGWLGASTDKASNTRGVSDNVPSFIRKTHLNKNIALEDLAINNLAFTVFNLNLFFFRDDGI